ncbi:hypothetical protein ACFQL4_15735 [Halosimplex aquaticum]
MTLDGLARAIVEHSDDISSDASAETVARMKTSLYHCHVPKLADAGLVTFDTDRKLVEPEDGFEQIEPHLGSVLGDGTEAPAPVKL